MEKLVDSFPRNVRFPKERRKRKGRPFQIPLKWKLYLTPYLCIEKSRMLRDEFFAFELGAYRKFRQLIMIRNEFVHTRVVDRGIDIQMTPVSSEARKDRIKSMLISPEYTDCCQEMGIDQDPVCFQVDNARVCGTAMREIIVELNQFLNGRILTKDFWESDKLDVAQ